MNKWPDKGEAQKILDEWVRDENLKRHAYAVAAAMEAYAQKLGGDLEKWWIVGLLHDFDYERYPDLKDHPLKGVSYLKEKGYADELTEAILAHAEHTNVLRDTDLKRAIFATDELTGLIMAVALMRPSKKIADTTVESVMKKWKDKAFARGVNRKLIERGAEELGTPLRGHIEIVLKAMQGIADKLGL
jgi:putative nucleotidyltransferase with HDIG domain